MATITPATTATSIETPFSERSSNYVSRSTTTWTDLSTADTATSIDVSGLGGVVGVFEVNGTFGSATIVLQGSIDGTNWYVLEDVQGTAISATAAAMFEFDTEVTSIRPSSSGGTADDVTVTLTYRSKA